jgi:hypothetical protein
MCRPACDLDFFSTSVAAAGDPNIKDEPREATNEFDQRDLPTAIKPFTSPIVTSAEVGSTWQTPHTGTFIS